MKLDPEDEITESSAPWGVLLLAFLSGIFIAYFGLKSTLEDIHELKHLTSFDTYTATEGRFLQVKTRADTASPEDYYPDILFEYFVNGKSIWGWRLSYEEVNKPKAYWENRLRNYTVNQKTTVYYNPLDPKDSMVEKKNDGLLKPILKLLGGLAFVIFGLFLFYIPLNTWLHQGFR